MKKQNGFTLIELVVVMVILGILSAFAIPRFFDFRSAANLAVLNGLNGAIQSAMVTAHGAALASNLIASSGQSILMEGTSVDLVYAYPAATTGGICSAVVTSTGIVCSAAGVFTVNGIATCKATYTAATSLTVPAQVALDSSGC